MTATSTTLDLVAIKGRQQAAWSTGDYAVVGTTLTITGELLCEAIDLQAGERVLDVACGNGNAALAAVALVVYAKVGLAILRRAWFNLDRAWAGALVAAGALTLIF